VKNGLNKADVMQELCH